MKECQVGSQGKVGSWSQTMRQVTQNPGLCLTSLKEERGAKIGWNHSLSPFYSLLIGFIYLYNISSEEKVSLKMFLSLEVTKCF